MVAKETEGALGEGKAELDGVIKKANIEALAMNCAFEKVRAVLGGIMEEKETKDGLIKKKSVADDYAERSFTGIACFCRDVVSLKNEREKRVLGEANVALKAVKTLEGETMMAWRQAMESAYDPLDESRANLWKVEAFTQETAVKFVDFSNEHDNTLSSTFETISTIFQESLAKELKRSAPTKRQCEVTRDVAIF
eukprot:CAMPEP_0175039062 /NCGR_PEP_ID=MMETSP0052_2-20121109/301_1 /TAXON_ID=51329 ORGANISM="Polytomella parva, Strain SAG 63-3" /NCGR_SAMPLE_ID=MMETSP0052_2 /ASSEMBLY_ACC=CAM_ASM_000194 /LENGTH=194 /DNA_ID=CAMNT_0016300725 /DNA_START=2396 /DNA_END=2980 /DNA_ORIENTATION=+